LIRAFALTNPQTANPQLSIASSAPLIDSDVIAHDHEPHTQNMQTKLIWLVLIAVQHAATFESIVGSSVVHVHSTTKSNQNDHSNPPSIGSSNGNATRSSSPLSATGSNQVLNLTNLDSTQHKSMSNRTKATVDAIQLTRSILKDKPIEVNRLRVQKASSSRSANEATIATTATNAPITANDDHGHDDESNGNGNNSKRLAAIEKRTPHYLEQRTSSMIEQATIGESSRSGEKASTGSDDRPLEQRFTAEFEPEQVHEMLLKDEDGLLDAALLLGKPEVLRNHSDRYRRAWIESDCIADCQCEFVDSKPVNIDSLTFAFQLITLLILSESRFV
jgi:hypothetical protein